MDWAFKQIANPSRCPPTTVCDKSKEDYAVLQSYSIVFGYFANWMNPNSDAEHVDLSVTSSQQLQYYGLHGMCQMHRVKPDSNAFSPCHCRVVIKIIEFWLRVQQSAAEWSETEIKWSNCWPMQSVWHFNANSVVVVSGWQTIKCGQNSDKCN